MLKITETIQFDETEIKYNFIRAAGPGGQNVNKVATAVQLRFDVKKSALPDTLKYRLYVLAENKISHDGDLIIKANRFRTQVANKQDALNRLVILLKQAATPRKKRKKTKATAGSIQRRLDKKKIHSKLKSSRRKPPESH